MMSLPMKEPYRYGSPYAEELMEYIEKRACGLKESTWKSESRYTERLDRYLSEKTNQKGMLSSTLMEEWVSRNPWEKVLTQQKRINYTKKFFAFLARKGIDAELPAITFKNTQSDYVPYIFSTDEMRRILEAFDHYPSTIRSAHLSRSVPLAFRILYGCGLRCSELTGLRVSDVDFGRASLCIWDTKFHKSRYVPFSPSLGKRIQDYISQRYPLGTGNDYLIGNPEGGRYQTEEIHYWHRKLLYQAGIPHGGKGYGPRVHDYRHTFAVHSLRSSIQKGTDAMAFLPLLAAYLGHKDLRGTQHYLHLTSEVYPDILASLAGKYGAFLEGGDKNES